MLPQPVSKCREIILDSISDGVFTADLNWRIPSFNRAVYSFAAIIGRGRRIRRSACPNFQQTPLDAHHAGEHHAPTTR